MPLTLKNQTSGPAAGGRGTPDIVHYAGPWGQLYDGGGQPVMDGQGKPVKVRFGKGGAMHIPGSVLQGQPATPAGPGGSGGAVPGRQGSPSGTYFVMVPLTRDKELSGHALDDGMGYNMGVGAPSAQMEGGPMRQVAANEIQSQGQFTPAHQDQPLETDSDQQEADAMAQSRGNQDVILDQLMRQRGQI